MDNISAFFEKAVSSTFLKLLFTKDVQISWINGYYIRIGNLIDSFQVGGDVFKTASFINADGQQISRIVDIGRLQAKNEEARGVDQQVLNEQLLRLKNNHQQLKDTLSKYWIQVIRESY